MFTVRRKNNRSAHGPRLYDAFEHRHAEFAVASLFKIPHRARQSRFPPLGVARSIRRGIAQLRQGRQTLKIFAAIIFRESRADFSPKAHHSPLALADDQCPNSSVRFISHKADDLENAALNGLDFQPIIRSAARLVPAVESLG